jgi:hypothetical protein
MCVASCDLTTLAPRPPGLPLSIRLRDRWFAIIIRRLDQSSAPTRSFQSPGRDLPQRTVRGAS